MVLIAIDRHSRKILGYLCRNYNSVLAYCCSCCDVEFTTAIDLERHMVVHESLQTSTPTIQHTISEGDVPLNVLSDIEREKHLKMKYQLTPCSVQLFRFDNDDGDGDKDDDEDKGMDMEIDTSMAAAMDNTNQENTAPAKEQSMKRRPGPASKKHKIGNKDTKKVLKKQSPPAVCYLCGQKFHSTIALEQHQKTHIQSSIVSPVFPCKVCGKNVRNLKKHLHQHKNEKKNKGQRATASVSSTMVKPNDTKNILVPVKSVEAATLPTDTKVEEASSSTDAVITSIPGVKETENDITSNEAAMLSHDVRVESETSMPMPPIVIEEDPIDSQSTEQTVGILATTDESVLQENLIPEKVIQSPSDKKVQCDFCSKLVGISYRRIHMKKYHTNIPSETKN
ncbi:zinc finger protein 652-like [Sitodiplosis mosellana]|uniref:zinc finger protein 652-like n=1 Tax=Sitodiplosis mosellana TaxID=263140 RepID=UPI002443E89A|nr:zinc finger protein 652-like [Sitodiplosis mosellana]